MCFKALSEFHRISMPPRCRRGACKQWKSKSTVLELLHGVHEKVLSLNNTRLDKDWSISVKLIRSDIVTTDTLGLISVLIDGIRLGVLFLGVLPKLSTMPSWFKKWRQRMNSLSYIQQTMRTSTHRRNLNNILYKELQSRSKQVTGQTRTIGLRICQAGLLCSTYLRRLGNIQSKLFGRSVLRAFWAQRARVLRNLSEKDIFHFWKLNPGWFLLLQYVPVE